MLYLSAIESINNKYKNLFDLEKEKLSKIKIDETDLSTRTINGLKRIGILENQKSEINYVNDIIEYGLFKIIDAKSIGKKSFEDILSLLANILNVDYKHSNNQNDKEKIKKQTKKIIWNLLDENEKYIRLENWLYEKDVLQEYFLNPSSTYEKIAISQKLTRERIRQLINRQLRRDYNILIYYFQNNKINFKQFKIIKKIIRNFNLSISIAELKKQYQIKSEKIITQEKNIENKEVIKTLFENHFINDRFHMEEFEITLEEIFQYNQELKRINSMLGFKSYRSIFSKLERHPKIVYVNKNIFIKINPQKCNNIVENINNHFFKQHLKYGFQFMSTNDSGLIKKFNFVNSNSLHSFMKKLSTNDEISYKYQPRIEFTNKKLSLPKLVELQLKTWNIEDKTDVEQIYQMFENSNYNKNEISNILHSLNREKLSYVYFDKKIRKTY